MNEIQRFSGLRGVLSRLSLRHLFVALIAAIGLVSAAVLLTSWAPPRAGDIVLEEAHDPTRVEIPLEAQRSMGIALAAPVRQKLQSSVEATGIVSPDQSRYAHIAPLGGGVVEELYVNLGDRVRQGQPLVSYDNIELGELIGEHLNLLGGLARVEAAREVAGKVLDRARALLEVDAIAQQEFEVREAEYAQASASVQSQRADLARVEEKLHRFGLSDEEIGGLGSAPHTAPHRTSSHNVLRAPFGGIIVDFDVSPGEFVDREERLFTLVDTSAVWVLANIYEKDLGLVRSGEECTVQVASYPDETFTGQITYVSDFLDPASRTAKVRCVVPNPEGRLKLEMFATVSIQVQHGREALTVPPTALQEMNGDTVVFVQRGETRFERKIVSIGARAEDWVELLSGLQGDERVVTQGSFYLKSAILREQIGGEN